MNITLGKLRERLPEFIQYRYSSASKLAGAVNAVLSRLVAERVVRPFHLSGVLYSPGAYAIPPRDFREVKSIRDLEGLVDHRILNNRLLIEKSVDHGEIVLFTVESNSGATMVVADMGIPVEQLVGRAVSFDDMPAYEILSAAQDSPSAGYITLTLASGIFEDLSGSEGLLVESPLRLEYVAACPDLSETANNPVLADDEAIVYSQELPLGKEFEDAILKGVKAELSSDDEKINLVMKRENDFRAAIELLRSNQSIPTGEQGNKNQEYSGNMIYAGSFGVHR